MTEANETRRERPKRQRSRPGRTARLEARQAARNAPERCSCRRKTCPRYRNCEACREHHRAEGGLPDCERT